MSGRLVRTRADEKRRGSRVRGLLAACFAAAVSLSPNVPATGRELRGPTIVAPAPGTMSFVRSPQPGVAKLYWAVPEQPVVRSILSRNGGKTWGEHSEEFRTPAGHNLWGVTALRDRRGSTHMFPLITRGQIPGDLGVTYFLDIWHTVSRASRSKPAWSEPSPVFNGYVGAVINAVELPTGRIVVPFAEWIGGRPNGPPTGPNEITAIFSDDEGKTWKKANARLTAPVPAEQATDQVGAVEPAPVVLPDGRLWMLMRTQTGRLYESFSRDGVEWSAAAPSRFFSSDSPAALLRLGDGRILLIWNNCGIAEQVEGRGVYGGRDALHAAISGDGGRTWNGFREIYLDPLQSVLTPNMDRGTSYPSVAETTPGHVVIATGQGPGRRVIITMDVDWLYIRNVEDRFADGKISRWATFTEFGPALNWNRARAEGARLVAHPEQRQRSVLRLARPTADRPAEGAVWNFPAGLKGTFTTTVMLTEKRGTASIALTDHFTAPTAAAGEKSAVFRILLSGDKDNETALHIEPGSWHSVSLSWDLSKRSAIVAVDGTIRHELPAARQSDFGLSYVRFRTSSLPAEATDLLIERVQARITN